MPNASAGNNISSSAQINAGVIIGADLANDTITTTQIGTGGVGTDEIADGVVQNSDISASAGIVDTKLATISTAGKVSGAALTSLSSIPAGAGVIPVANLPGNATPFAGQTIVSSTVATALLDITIPANKLSTYNLLYVYIPIWGIKKAGTGAANAVYLTVGGTNSATINPDNNAATYTDDRGFIEAWIWADGSTSAQRTLLRISHGQDNNASAATQWWTSSATGSLAKDSTATITFKLNWQNGTSSANDYIKTGTGFYQYVTA